MADYSIATMIKPPAGVSAIAPVLNAAQGLQNLQAQRQAIGIRQTQLESAQQANLERQNMVQFLSNPDNFQTNGQIDLGKVDKAIPQLAPQTGAKWMGDLTALANAQVATNKAKTDLTTEQRGIIAGPLGVLGRAGITDPNAYIKEIDNVIAQNPDNTQLAQIGQAYKNALSVAQPGPGIAKEAVTLSQTLMGPSAQQQQLSPTIGLQNTGAQLQPVVSQPYVAGQAPSLTVGAQGVPLNIQPGQQQFQTHDLFGNVVLGNRSPTGEITGYTAPPGAGYTPVMTAPPGETAATGQELLKERQQAQAAAVEAPQQHFYNQQILQLPDDAFTGTGSGKLADFLNNVAFQKYPELANEKASNTVRLQHFLGLSIQANATAAGMTTDAGRQLAAQATLPKNAPAAAIRNITRINDALVTGSQWYNQGMQAAINNPANKVGAFALRAYKNAWSENFDPNVARYIDALQNGDQKEIRELDGELGKQGVRNLIPKVIALQSLISTGRLPGK